MNSHDMVRQVNEQFRSLERAFLDYNSLESRGYMLVAYKTYFQMLRFKMNKLNLN